MLIIFIVFQIVFTGFSTILVVFYGPFSNLKRLVVGTAMSSYSHKYIATVFLSDKKIESIIHPKTEVIKNNEIQANNEEDAQQEIDDIVVSKKLDNSVERFDIDGGKYKGYVIIVNDPTRIKVGSSKYLGSIGQTTKEIAEENGAIAAINGGGFMDTASGGKLWVGTGASPTGVVMSAGKVIYNDSSNETKQSIMGFTKDGKLIVGLHTTNELQKLGVMEALSFGPGIIVNGKNQIQGDGGQGITARTAIGQKKTGEVILLVLDGRRLNMPGATLKDVQNVMAKYDAYNAINLDGGSSTTMYYDGDVINNPCNPFGERSIATAVYVSP
ncbi:MAG: phosphodiester glycosidase family protein [Clostridiaceae bacterium]|nr:phosphodiester glycosidase family protein [Clostridiaceae bacterium]